MKNINKLWVWSAEWMMLKKKYADFRLEFSSIFQWEKWMRKLKNEENSMKISIINISAEKKCKIPHHITFSGNIKCNEMKKLQHEPRVGVKLFRELKLKKLFHSAALWLATSPITISDVRRTRQRFKLSILPG